MSTIVDTPPDDLAAFTSRSMESLYRERARRSHMWYPRHDRYGTMLQQAIEQLEHYGKLRRRKRIGL